MGLTAALLRFGYPVPRPLIVTSPGHTATRLAVEAELRRRGGRPATGPGEADTLLTCGALTGDYRDAAQRVWRQLPRPRARVEVTGLEAAPAALTSAVAQLHDLDAQRRPDETPSTPAVRRHLAVQERSRHSDEMEMMPAGLAMADTAPDRDGLQLDALHIRLGPVLAYWPAGLALRLTVQGDVVQHAEYATFGLDAHDRPPAPPFWDACALALAGGDAVNAVTAGRRIAAAHLDSLVRLLAVAGWSRAAAAAARLRDDVLADTDAQRCAASLRRFAGHVLRSAALRWSLRDVGVLTAEHAIRAGLSGPAVRAGGDAYARLRAWLREAERALLGDVVEQEGPRGTVTSVSSVAAYLEVVRELVVGTDLAHARLIVASLDPDLDQLVGAAVGGLRG